MEGSRDMEKGYTLINMTQPFHINRVDISHYTTQPFHMNRVDIAHFTTQPFHINRVDISHYTTNISDQSFE